MTRWYSVVLAEDEGVDDDDDDADADAVAAVGDVESPLLCLSTSFRLIWWDLLLRQPVQSASPEIEEY